MNTAKIRLGASDADPDHFDTDPDQTFHFDPDPTICYRTDPATFKEVIYLQ